MTTLSSFFKSHTVYSGSGAQRAMNTTLTKDAFADSIYAWEQERLTRQARMLNALDEVFEGTRRVATLSHSLVLQTALRILHSLSEVSQMSVEDKSYDEQEMKKLIKAKIACGEFIESSGKKRSDIMLKRA